MNNLNKEFKSKSGNALSSSQNATKLYFVGFNGYNPIRDRILNSVPFPYSDNIVSSNFSRILNVHSEELYEAQKNIGRILSDNYIRVPVQDEIRLRNSTAKDLLSNENCFNLKRVSLNPSGSNYAKKYRYI